MISLLVTDSSNLLDQDVLSLEPSDTAECMLLAPSSQDEADMVEEGDDVVCSEPSQPASPTYKELLDD